MNFLSYYFASFLDRYRSLSSRLDPCLSYVFQVFEKLRLPLFCFVGHLFLNPFKIQILTNYWSWGCYSRSQDRTLYHCGSHRVKQILRRLVIFLRPDQLEYVNFDLTWNFAWLNCSSFVWFASLSWLSLLYVSECSRQFTLLCHLLL